MVPLMPTDVEERESDDDDDDGDYQHVVEYSRCVLEFVCSHRCQYVLVQ